MAPAISVRMNGREDSFASGSIRIGRDPQDNDLLSTNPLVSRRHAVLSLAPHGWELHDVGSRHGVFAHGARVPKVRVDTSMTIWLGPPRRGQLLQLVPGGGESPTPFAIFISYRREDGAGYATLLNERLAARFGASSIFRDIEAIRPGTDFVDKIESAIGSCAAIVVLIGREWVGPTPDGKRRIDNPGDVLRQEIVAALELGVRVIPVLVQGALMPPASSLPQPLRPLSNRHALRIDDTNVDASVAQLISVLDDMRGATDSGQSPAEPADVDADTSPLPKVRGTRSRRGRTADRPGARVAAAWWLLPVFFNVVGGVIAYVAIRDRARETARQMLILGLIMTAILGVVTVLGRGS